MKRLLLFLVVFGTGLGLLLYLQGDPGEEDEAPPEDTQVVESESELIPVPRTHAQPPAATEAAPAGGRVGLSGAIHYKRRQKPELGGEIIFTLNASDSSTAAEGWLELVDVVLDYPGTGVLTAKRGRVAVESSAALLKQRDLGSRIELEEGHIRLDERHPLAPAVVTSPRIEGQLDTQVFRLLGGPRLESSGLSLGGEEIQLDLISHQVLAKGEALAQLLGSAGEVEQFLSGESLQLDAHDPLEVRLEAAGQAALSLLSASPDGRPLVLHAPTVELLGKRVGLPGERRLEITKVEVPDGGGRLTSGQTTVSGEAFQFRFDESGRAGQVAVSGQARAVFPAQLAEQLGLDLPSETKHGDFVLTCERVLTLTMDRQLELISEGRSELQFDQLRLVASDGFEGYRSTSSNLLHLEGHGEVRLLGSLPPDARGAVPQIDYSSRELIVEHQVTAAGSQMLLETKASTQLEVNDSLAGQVSLSAAQGMRLELLQGEAGASWSIPAAAGLSFEVLSSTTRLAGTADQVKDFDPERFAVDGWGLSVERASLDPGQAPDLLWLSASGSFVHTNGEGDLIAKGDAQQPAHFASHAVTIDADSLRRQASTLRASGGVRALLELQEGRSRFRCESLLVEGLDLEAEPPRAARVLAEGSVDAYTWLADQELGLRAAWVELVRIDQEQLELHAHTGVHLELDEASAVWSVDADRLDAFASGSPTTPPVDGGSWLEVVARDDLVVKEQQGAFRGRGQALYIERGPISRVRLEGGEELAQVNGQLPGRGLYQGRVSELLLEGERLEAKNLKGTLGGLFVPGTEALDSPERVNVRCDLLTATVEGDEGAPRDVIQLDGEVHITQAQADGTLNSFEADHATFMHDQAADEDPSGGFDLQHSGFIAHGQVRLRRGSFLDAYGDHLELAAGSSELRFEGTPAAVIYGGFCSMSTWITLDPRTMQLECGGGNICMDPALIARLFPKDDGR